ncbi:MAG TPA: phosphotransferase [Longimicrobium sp.]|nr:phosphotransferase [Longimicrobium sp.]
MSGAYVGVLEESDPLHAVLTRDVLAGRLGCSVASPVYDVFRLDGSGTIYRYAERRTYVEVVGKFFGRKWLHGRQDGEPELRQALLRREFENLCYARGLGLDAYPHQVVRALAASAATGCVLVEDYVRGLDLEHFIRHAAHGGSGHELRDRLSDVASFLADLHTRSARNEGVSEAAGGAYLEKIIGQLAYWDVVPHEQRGRLEALRDRWAASGLLGRGRNVLVHGDCTPLHFFHAPEHGITAIDMERARPADRAWDLGCMAAELKHLFWWYTGDREAGEPYIRHFYGAYAGFLPPGEEDFGLLTARGRFFMACYELRTSRNPWLDLGYRRELINHAEACLQI